jgi:predicted nucleic acid-binding protein
VISDHILEEIRRTLAKPYFSRHLTPDDQAAGVELFREDATVTPITVVVGGVATHPEDDLVLATAVSGNVDYLVTRDRQLLRLGTYQGVRIVSTGDFLALLPPLAGQ